MRIFSGVESGEALQKQFIELCKLSVLGEMSLDNDVVRYVLKEFDNLSK